MKLVTVAKLLLYRTFFGVGLLLSLDWVSVAKLLLYLNFSGVGLILSLNWISLAKLLDHLRRTVGLLSLPNLPSSANLNTSPVLTGSNFTGFGASSSSTFPCLSISAILCIYFLDNMFLSGSF